MQSLHSRSLKERAWLSVFEEKRHPSLTSTALSNCVKAVTEKRSTILFNVIQNLIMSFIIKYIYENEQTNSLTQILYIHAVLTRSYGKNCKQQCAQEIRLGIAPHMNLIVLDGMFMFLEPNPGRYFSRILSHLVLGLREAVCLGKFSNKLTKSGFPGTDELYTGQHH